MRTIVVTVLALVLGFALGIILSEVIGIIGVVVFNRVIGIKYLPFYTSIVLMIFANLTDAFIRRKSRKA